MGGLLWIRICGQGFGFASIGYPVIPAFTVVFSRFFIPIIMLCSETVKGRSQILKKGRELTFQAIPIKNVSVKVDKLDSIKEKS